MLEKAERDLTTAERMSDEGTEFADVVCFHSQQCAEKALKALIAAPGNEPPRSHDLGVLVEALEEQQVFPADVISAARLLADFGVAPRYPGWEDAVGHVDLPVVLRAARKVLEFVFARLGLAAQGHPLP